MISLYKPRVPRSQSFNDVYCALVAVLGADVELTGTQLAQARRVWMSGRVRAGLADARARGVQLGRPWKIPPTAIPDGGVRAAARIWGVSKSTAARWINRITKTK